jgi:hypothetical protein
LHDNQYYQRAIEKSFLIVDKEMKTVPFILNPPQTEVLKELGGMDIILKARQEGISSLIAAIFAIDFITIENIRCVIISHEDKATQRLFDRVRFFLDSMQKTFPGELPYKLTRSSTHELKNETMNSYYYIGTAGARAFGHGETINDLHVSELSRWPEQEKMMTGLMQAVPKDGRVIIETTANGYGDYFNKLWTQNKDTQYPYRTHFIPWFKLPEYVLPLGGLTTQELIDDEKSLMLDFGLKLEQLAWRRWKINQMGGDFKDPKTWDTFKEQYPSTAEEAFIVSGNPVWSPTLMNYYLQKCKKPKLIGNLRGYDPISIEENERGFVRIWKEPQEFHTYAIGVDVAEGKVVLSGDEKKDRDSSCAQVFDKTTYEQVAVWYGNVDPDILGLQLDMLGRYYNNALIGVERNAVGITPLIKLRDLNYPHLYYREKLGLITEKVTSELGWVTDHSSKEQIISEATEMFRDKRISIYDEDTVSEMRSFVRNVDGRAGATKGRHDDRVMSMLIGIKMLSKAKNSSYTNDIEKGDVNEEAGFYMGGASFDSKGMPTEPSQMGDLGGGEF